MNRVLSLALCLSCVVLIFGSSSGALAFGGKCLALAQNLQRDSDARIQYANFQHLKEDEVEITFVGHSTFRIVSPSGVNIATDYAGWAGNGPPPDVVTMNHAHESHYTDYVDDRIAHVLKGWNDKGPGPVEHDLEVGDVWIRNVTTDIRLGAGFREKDGNSIFIFETANLCIGHLGHLHHELAPPTLGWIGYLDVVMVPVDGTFTMDVKAMARVMKDIRARLILPMHYFGTSSLEEFLTEMGQSFDIEVTKFPSVIVSERSLPKKPKILVLSN